MWVFTTTGMVSAVQIAGTKDRLKVRARDYASLVPLAKHVRPADDPQKVIQCGGGTDYPYRLIVNRETFAAWVYQQAMDVDYTNYKDAVTAKGNRGPAWHDPLMRVWTAMLGVTPRRVARKQRWRQERDWVQQRYAQQSAVRRTYSIHDLNDDEWRELQEAPPY